MIKKLLSAAGLVNTANVEKGLPEIKFYKDAAPFGEHGKIVVTNPKLNLRENTVSFCFVGVIAPMELNLFTMSYIWEEARAQGYIPVRIAEYGKIVDTANA